MSVGGEKYTPMDVVEKEEATINWDQRKKEYLTWTLYGFLCSEKYWEPLKQGLQSGKIKFEPIEYVSPEMTIERGFLAYAGPVKVEGEDAIVLYPSPLWMYAKLVLSKKTVRVYAASSNTDPSFKVLNFKQEHKASLPEGLEINENYLPGWKTDLRIALWYNKWASEEDKDLPSQFEKMSLTNKETELNNPCLQHCGIQPIPRNDKKENQYCITH